MEGGEDDTYEGVVYIDFACMLCRAEIDEHVVEKVASSLANQVRRERGRKKGRKRGWERGGNGIFQWTNISFVGNSRCK